MTSNVAYCTEFKRAQLRGQINVTSDTFKIAFYTPSASLGNDTAAYTTSNEVSGFGYTAGGFQLTGGTIWQDGNVIGVTFDNFVSSTPMTISNVAAALIYDASSSNVALCVLTFPVPYQFSNQTVTINFPTANAETGLLANFS
jgi:hypothetical protein